MDKRLNSEEIVDLRVALWERLCEDFKVISREEALEDLINRMELLDDED